MEEKRKTVTQIAYYSFYLGVIIEVLLVLIDKSAYTNPIEGQIFRLTLLLFLAKVCLTKYSLKEYLCIGFFMGIGAISYFATGRNELIRIVVFLAACKDINMIQCLKIVFWMTLSGCLVIAVLSVTGLYGSICLTQDYGRRGVETRYALGMGHPNALQCMVLVLTLLALYLYHEKWKWYHYISVFLVNVLFFLLTDSKSALLVSVYAIGLYLLAAKIRRAGTELLFSAGNIFVFAGSIVISVMSAKDAMCLWHYYWEGTTNAKIKFYVLLDNLLTGRIHSLIETNNHEGIMDTWSLFSRSENNYYFDMGWVRLFYWYGVIPALLVIAVLAGVAFFFLKERKKAELVFLSSIALYTIIEAHFISVYIARNYLLFIMGMYWCELIRIQKNRNVAAHVI